MSKENEQQRRFMERMQDILKEARENGNMIPEETLRERLGDLSLDEAQMEQVRAFLAAGGVGIGEALSAEEVLTEEEYDHLQEYQALVDAIEVPDSNILEAMKLSAMAGERPAQKRLTEVSLGKVIDIARLYAGQGVYMEDLIGAGNEALTIAVTQLAPLESPAEVDGYLGRRIMDAMEDLIAENIDAKALDKRVEEKVNDVADKARELAEAIGRKVSPEEVAREYEIDVEEVREAVRLSGYAIEDIETDEKKLT